MRPKTPLLKPRHFAETGTWLSERGLGFDERVSREEREACAIWAPEERSMEDVLARIPRRAATRCVVNPPTLPAAALLQRMTEAQKAFKRTEAAVAYGLTSTYDLGWKLRGREEFGMVEGQSLVMVAFAEGDAPAGFATLEVSLTRCYDQKELFVFTEAKLVFVVPEQRGQGYGIDLSIACSQLLSGVLSAAYRAAPRGWSLAPTLFADYESEGGQAFVRHLYAEMGAHMEILEDLEPRAGDDVSVCAPRLDAGW